MTQATPSNQEQTDRVLLWISHPLRLEIQCILLHRAASPKEIAEELGEKLSDVSYHVNVLLRDGSIELVDTAPRRGALEHFYRATKRPFHSDRAWGRLPRAVREELTAVTLGGVLGEAMRALNHETFDARRDRHLSWLAMELDDEGWLDLLDELRTSLERLEAIKAEAAERLEDAGEDGARVVAGMLGFETPPGEGLAPHRTSRVE